MPKASSTKRRLTQYDIARMLGVSQTTVSQVLSNRATANIPYETRERILEAARQLGYVPDRIARSLRTGKTYIIAAVIPDITNPFYPAFVRGIQDIAEAYDYHVATYNTDGQIDKERQMIEVVQQARVDGLIMSPFHRDRMALRPMLERHIPVVLLDDAMDLPDFNNLPLDTIATDGSSTEKAIAYLASHGHRRIAMFSSRLAHAGIVRAERYQRAMRDLELDFDSSLIIWGKDFTEQSGYDALQMLMQIEPRPTAVFAASDQLALGALRAAKQRGLTVPNDLAIVGVDDISAATLVSPMLTTIAQHQKQQGRQAARLLFERLTQEYQGPGRHMTMPCELIIRESA